MEKIRKAVITVFFTAFIMILPILVMADDPKIVSVSMIPANPQFGDYVQITVTMCCPNYNTSQMMIAFSTFNTIQPTGTGGQVFVVDATGVDVKNVNETNSGATSYQFAAANGLNNGNCTDCGGGTTSTLITQVFNVHVPNASYFASCNPTSLYLVVGAKSSYMGAGDWAALPATCQTSFTSFPIVAPPKAFQITKSYQGELQQAGDEVLFSIAYNYANGAGFQISDPIPAGFTVLSYGPTVIPGGSVTTGGTYTWKFPDRTSQAGVGSGTVWVLCQVTGTPSGSYTNTATGSWAGANPQTSSVTVTTGQAAISITKNESATSILANGPDDLTYTLSYNINGMQLKNFQSFDNATTGTYCPSGCTNSGPPTGWQFLPSNGNYGTWTVADPCNTGGHYITGASSSYPGLLLNDGGSHTTDQFCTGQIVTDFFINPGTFPGADAQVIIRNNTQSGAAGYSLGIVASIDNQPGYLALQLVSAGGNPTYDQTVTPGVGPVSASKWYTMRIQASGPDGDHIQARIWARGDPEPSYWDIDYTDPALATAPWACDGTGTYTDWRPGVNEQTGSSGDVQDSYDNFSVFAPRTTDNAFVDDTVPTNMTYAGCIGCTGSSTPVLWNIGTVSQQSGSFTWWGKVVGCGEISNQALIGSSGNSPVLSNWVNAAILCWSPTFTPTPTFTVTNTINPSTPTFTPTRTATPTYTSTYTQSDTRTFTPTFTPTSTFTATPTFTSTFTMTPTYTQTSTKTATPTFTDTNTYTPTATPTYTYTDSPSPSFTPTYTPTYTQTSTKTATPTFTDTKTDTQTVTETNTVSSNTPTYTPTYTATPTNTPTFTVTKTDTPTDTETSTVTDSPTYTATTSPTFTPTDTPTYTQTSTVTSTPTYTATTSPTFTPTDTPTYTVTDTFTMTYTATDTPTYTPTFTDTPVNSATDTPTYTPTFTASPTYTFTFTMTDTPTSTDTPTATPTITMTFTPTDTPTNTPTFTMTYTRTNTPTITPTLPPFPYTISIGVYNSAGELVKTVAVEPASTLLTTVDFSEGSNTDPTTVIPGQPLTMYLPGMITPDDMGQTGTAFTWDGTTNAKQPAASGSYYIKIQQVDTYNHVSVLIRDFSVMQVEQYVELIVYNSAGEIVYDHKQYTNAPNNVTLRLADIIPVQKGGNNNIQVIYGPALTDYITWNGLNSNGVAVESGTYEIKILSRTLEGSEVTASKTVIVLSEGSKYLDNIKAYPNPYTGTGNITFAWTSAYTGKITIRIYNMSGEIVRTLSGDLGAGSLAWNCTNGAGSLVSQGYYVAVLTSQDDQGYVNNKIVKFAITNKP